MTPEERRAADYVVSLDAAKNRVAEAIDELTWLISATPTGQDRVLLSEANINVMMAREKLREVKQL